MARDDERDAIGTVGAAHRSRGLRFAQTARQFAVAARFAERDLQQCGPDRALPVRTDQAQWQVKDLTLPACIFRKLRAGGAGPGGVTYDLKALAAQLLLDRERVAPFEKGCEQQRA